MSVLCSNFEDIFNVDHFIDSLRDEVNIIKSLPPKVKRDIDKNVIKVHSMPPISWSNMTYYYEQVRRRDFCSRLRFMIVTISVKAYAFLVADLTSRKKTQSNSIFEDRCSSCKQWSSTCTPKVALSC